MNVFQMQTASIPMYSISTLFQFCRNVLEVRISSVGYLTADFGINRSTVKDSV